MKWLIRTLRIIREYIWMEAKDPYHWYGEIPTFEDYYKKRMEEME